MCLCVNSPSLIEKDFCSIRQTRYAESVFAERRSQGKTGLGERRYSTTTTVLKDLIVSLRFSCYTPVSMLDLNCRCPRLDFKCMVNHGFMRFYPRRRCSLSWLPESATTTTCNTVDWWRTAECIRVDRAGQINGCLSR
jgi:hypothetical protein